MKRNLLILSGGLFTLSILVFAFGIATSPLWPSQNPTEEMQFEYKQQQQQEDQIVQIAKYLFFSSIASCVIGIFVKKKSV